MDDVISRQEVIDAVADLYWMDERLLNFKKEIDVTFDKIKALPSAQPEPCEDTISRQAVLDALQKHFNPTGEELSPDLASVLAGVGVVINTMPPSPSRPQWIPCSEKLPEANGRYLVTRGLVAAGALWNRIYIANYSNLMGIKSVKIWWQGNVGKSDFERLDDVLAWMPLPEPYIAERKTDDTD